jgi:quercetin dioxygenase-like cupin family protein
MQHERLDQNPRVPMVPGVSIQPVFGEATMINLVHLEPGAEVPLHSHPHEQLGYVVRGVLLLSVEGVEHPIAPNEAYALPGDVEHSAVAGPEGALVVDVFAPIREDYRELARKHG